MPGISLIPTYPWPAVTACETPAVPVIGWLDDIESVDGVAAHANEGAGTIGPIGTPPLSIGPTYYAGVVGYTEGDVVWTPTFTPVSGGASPVLTDMGGGVVRVVWQPTPAPYDFVRGLLSLTATVDGVPVADGQAIEMTVSNFSYSTVAWGPEP